MNKRIKELVDQGYEVESRALGRFGKVERVLHDGRLVKLVGGVTTFDRGDPCDIEWNGEKYLIKNWSSINDA